MSSLSPLLCLWCLRAEAKKALHDVYRCVFMLRRDVFTNRPLPPTSSGQVHMYMVVHVHVYTCTYRDAPSEELWEQEVFLAILSRILAQSRVTPRAPTVMCMYIQTNGYAQLC